MDNLEVKFYDTVNDELLKFADKNDSIIGAIVTVTVDRPLGSYHPEYKDMYYPINYGYIEGIIVPDAEEKWVVVPDGMMFSKDKIRQQIHFQEQYFDSKIVM